MEVFFLSDSILNTTSSLLLKVGNIMVIKGLGIFEIFLKQAPPLQGTHFDYEKKQFFQKVTHLVCQSFLLKIHY